MSITPEQLANLKVGDFVSGTYQFGCTHGRITKIKSKVVVIERHSQNYDWFTPTGQLQNLTKSRISEIIENPNIGVRNGLTLTEAPGTPVTSDKREIQVVEDYQMVSNTKNPDTTTKYVFGGVGCYGLEFNTQKHWDAECKPLIETGLYATADFIQVGDVLRQVVTLTEKGVKHFSHLQAPFFFSHFYVVRERITPATTWANFQKQ